MHTGPVCERGYVCHHVCWWRPEHSFVKVVLTFYLMWAPATEFKTLDFAVNTFTYGAITRDFYYGGHICVCMYICARTRVGIYGGQRSEDNLMCPSLGAVHLSHTRLSRVWSLPRPLSCLANESQRICWLSRPSLVHDILPNFLRGFTGGI